MCIRDRSPPWSSIVAYDLNNGTIKWRQPIGEDSLYVQGDNCLLYTSDAADERSSVDLGGRRIIKKKKQRSQVKSSGSDTKTCCKSSNKCEQ